MVAVWPTVGAPVNVPAALAVGTLAVNVVVPIVSVELLLILDELTVPTVTVADSSAPSKPALQSFTMESLGVGNGFLLPGSGFSGKPRSIDRKSTRLNSSHLGISYAVFCLKKKKQI